MQGSVALKGIDPFAEILSNPLSVVTQNLKDVSNTFEKVAEGVQTFAKSTYQRISTVDKAKVNVPLERVEQLEKILHQLDENTKKTVEFTVATAKKIEPMSTAHRGLKKTLEHLKAATPDQLKVVEGEVEAEADGEPVPITIPDESLKRLKRALRASVSEFWANAHQVDVKVLNEATANLSQLQEEWKSLAALIENEITKWSEIESAMSQRVKELEEVRWWCYLGAACCVVAGVVATVGLTIATGGANLLPEALALGGVALAGGGYVAANHFAPEKTAAVEGAVFSKVCAATGLAPTHARNACTAALGSVSVLGASIRAAQQMVSQSQEAKADYETGVAAIRETIAKLEGLKQDVDRVQRSCFSTEQSLSCCATQWNKLKSKFEGTANSLEDCTIPQVVDELLLTILMDGKVSFLAMEADLVVSTQAYETLERELRELGSKAILSYKKFEEPQSDTGKSMHDILFELRQYVKKQQKQ